MDGLAAQRQKERGLIPAIPGDFFGGSADLLAGFLRGPGLISSLAKTDIQPGQLHAQHGDVAQEIAWDNDDLLGLNDLIVDRSDIPPEGSGLLVVSFFGISLSKDLPHPVPSSSIGWTFMDDELDSHRLGQDPGQRSG